MTEKWTPGEWAVDGNSIIGPDRQIVAISTGEDFGGYFGDEANVEAEQAANAHLIAAAPVLYRALKGIVFWNGTDDYTEALAALAKARGEA